MSELRWAWLVAAAAALVAYPTPFRIAALPTAAGARAGAACPETVRSMRTRWRRALVVTLGLWAGGFLLGVWTWWIGLGVAAICGGATLRLGERRSQAEVADARQRLAVQCDLLAACLDAGIPIGAALMAIAANSAGTPADTRAVGVDDPLRVLEAVAALLMLGADADTAWRSAQADPDLAPLAAAARRSAAAGSGFAAAAREHAVGLRAANAAAAQRSGARAGVAVTAPLGLCFLPAFVCLGLAPVVVALLTSLHPF